MGGSNTDPDIAMDVARPESSRRLPVYLLLDCSYSMQGAPIAAAQQGMEEFVRDVMADGLSRSSVHLGVILFGGEGGEKGVRFITNGLVPVEQFSLPQLKADGVTPLGSALREFARSVDRDLIPTVEGSRTKGDFRPLAFIFTDGKPTDADGRPTDDWRAPRQEILDRVSRKVVTVITVGCGPELNEKTLKEIAIGHSFILHEKTPESFVVFFQWISSVTRHVSHQVTGGQGRDESPVDLPPAPPALQYVP